MRPVWAPGLHRVRKPLDFIGGRAPSRGVLSGIAKFFTPSLSQGAVLEDRLGKGAGRHRPVYRIFPEGYSMRG
jgi:hypothetical protein